eukprot:1252021-Pyramimonas_sp.AAC.1
MQSLSDQQLCPWPLLPKCALHRIAVPPDVSRRPAPVRAASANHDMYPALCHQLRAALICSCSNLCS